MGTTLTAIAFPRGASSCALAHVGDSRAYRLRDGRLDLLTRDHTWVQDQVDAGRLDPEQARVHPYANVLSRVLGLPALDLVETTIIEVKPHDVLLLCSDGLTAMLEEENIQAILHAQPDLQAAAAQLIDTANAHGGVDNVTVVLIRALDGATGA
jgi:protein phosphatase